MSKKIQKEIVELLFEVYEKGVQQKDADLTSYYEKISALSIPDVVQQRELLQTFCDKMSIMYKDFPCDEYDIECYVNDLQ